jgi:signal transduction histidine kinase
MFQDVFTYLLYLVYGLVFFAMGVSITSKVTRGSTLEIARCLWLFTLFAFIHALHEFSELYMVLGGEAIAGELLLTIKSWKLLPVFLSFFFLLVFGVRVLGIVYPARRRMLFLLPPILLAVLAWAVFGEEAERSTRFLRLIDLRMRNIIGFPAAVLAGVGFILYSKTLRHLSDRVARNFTGAGVFLIVYGVLAGLIPSRTIIWDGGAQVEFFRALSAVFILHFTMNALHVFDIERHGQIEERLQRFARSEKLTSLGKLAAGIAHEINNPLTNVSIGVSLLKKSFPVDAEAATVRRFESIERNIDRASKIARELLFFSRNEEPELIPTDLNEVIRDTMVLLGARRNEFAIREELAELPVIRAIPWKLEEVFLNVLINAMEASAPGSEICLKSYEKDDMVVAEVSDQGPGIAPENLGRIFDPFFTTKEVGKGTGLGLALCFGIMEMHGGRIEVESTSERGTTFSLIFPAGREAHA